MFDAKVLFHSSIRLTGEKTVYCDPFRIEGAPHDADVILVTHDHFDHFSPEDIERVKKPGSVLVAPESMKKTAAGAGLELVTVRPGQTVKVCGVAIEAVPAYTIGRPFHPKQNEWVGYVVTLDGVRCYIAGDTDKTPDNEKVRCDVAMLPIGGKYTMDVPQAAALANILRPGLVIPTHYGEVAGAPEDGPAFAALVDNGIRVEIHLYA